MQLEEIERDVPRTLDILLICDGARNASSTFWKFSVWRSVVISWQFNYVLFAALSSTLQLAKAKHYWLQLCCYWVFERWNHTKFSNYLQSDSRAAINLLPSASMLADHKSIFHNQVWWWWSCEQKRGIISIQISFRLEFLSRHFLLLVSI